MKLKVQRIFKGDTYTIGKLYIDDVYYCDTLEDKWRIINNDCSMKIYGKTCIPEGEYKINMVWWEKHKNIYPQLVHVPCFSGILIHGGNTDKDTEGCILVGKNTIKGQLTESSTTMEGLRNRLKNEKDITIEIC